MTTTAIEGTPQSQARAEFMARLSEHEEVLAELAQRLFTEGRGGDVEAYRMSRRAVMAAYDRATLGAGKSE